MSNLTNEQYIAVQGARCPCCDSERIEGRGRVDVDGGFAYQGMYCLNCNASWKDSYKLRGYMLKVQGEQL